MTDNEFDLQALLDDINDLVQSVAPDGKFLYVNRAWRETLGYSESEIPRLNMFDIIHPDSRAHWLEMFQRVMKGENLKPVEADFIAKNGEIITVEGSSICSYRNGEPFATRSIFRDITERKKAEQTLRHSEDLFQAFMKNSPVVAFMKDEEGRYVYANETFESMFQIKTTTLIGMNDFEWLPKEIAQSVWEADQIVLSTRTRLELLEKVPTPDGSARYWTVLKFPFTDTKGKNYVGGIAIDVTKEKDAEKMLRLQQQEIETLVNNSQDVIMRFNRKLQHIFVNSALEKETGIVTEKFIGKNMREIGLPTEFCDLWNSKLEEVFGTGQGIIFDSSMNTPRGLSHHQSRLTPEFGVDNKSAETILVISRDITNQKQAEEKLRQSENFFRKLIENGLGFVCTHARNGDILSVNPASASSLGYSTDELIGKNLGEIVKPGLQNEVEIYLKRVWKNKSDAGAVIVSTKNGSEQVWKYHNIILTETVESPFILGYAQDVTDLKKTEDKLRSLSLTDDLTGLYNRRGFFLLTERQIKIARSRPTGKYNYLMFADIDGLKNINDAFGHEQGSTAIVKMGELLAGNFRTSDIVARFGGDEFVILMVNANDDSSDLVLDRLQDKINNYNAEKNHPFEISISVGVTTIDLNAEKPLEEILAEADEAMYVQKRRKKRLV